MTLSVLLKNLVNGGSNKIENYKQINEFGFEHFEFKAGKKKKRKENRSRDVKEEVNYTYLRLIQMGETLSNHRSDRSYFPTYIKN